MGMVRNALVHKFTKQCIALYVLKSRRGYMAIAIAELPAEHPDTSISSTDCIILRTYMLGVMMSISK